MLKKIIKYIFFIKKIKIEFKINKKKILLIGYPIDTQLFNRHISNNTQITQYPETLNPYILFLTILKKKKSSNFLQNYLINYIEYCNPNLIINFIDNYTKFYELKKFFDKKKFISIQNGYRGGPRDFFNIIKNKAHLPELRCDYLLTFNDIVSKEFQKYIKCKTLTIGSFRNNFFTKKNYQLNNSLAFISSYKCNYNHLIYYQKDKKKIYYRDFWKAEKLIVSFLEKYCEENNLLFSIILRSNDPEEKNFYNDITKKDINFLERLNNHSSYEYLEKVNYFVGTENTMTYEALSRKKKIAVFTIRKNLLKNLTGVEVEGLSFFWPGKLNDEGKFWTHIPNSNSFLKVMDFVVKSNEEEWKLELDKINEEFQVNYDKDNSILKNLINDQIN